MSATTPQDPVNALEDAEQAALEELDDVPNEPIAVPTPKGLGRWMPRSLLGRQLLILGAILSVGTVLLLQHFREVAVQDVVSAEQRRILALAQVASGTVDGSAHEAAVQASPGRDAFVAWDSAPEAVQTERSALAEFARQATLSSPAYTLRIREDARERVISEPGRPHPDALEFTLSSAEAPYWRHPLTYRPAMEAAFFSGTPAVSGQYADEHGEWVTAWAPIHDTDGTVVAVVGIDAPLSTLLAPLETRQWRDARILAVTFALTFLAVVVLVRQLGSGLRDIQAAAERIGEGDYATPVQAFGFAEVVQLARGLEFARRRVAKDMNRLEGLRKTLGRRLAEAAEQVDAMGRKRRRRYARLAGDLRVSVAVGGAARMLPGRLIDLTYERMVVGMRRELAPDLAGGMVATIHMETRNHKGTFSYDCVSVAVTRIDEMNHLSFRVKGGIQIEALPPPVAKVLNQRRALRVAPGPDTDLRVAVRRNPHVRPVATEVLDISSDGIKVVLPISLKRFSNWGTTMEVAIRFQEEDPALRMRGKVRNCHGTPDGRVAVGVSFEGEGIPAFEQHQQAIQQWVMMADRAQREANNDRKVS